MGVCIESKYFIVIINDIILGLLWWLSGKESACSAEDRGSIPAPGRSHMLQDNEAYLPRAHTPKTHALQRETTTMRSLHVVTRE